MKIQQSVRILAMSLGTACMACSTPALAQSVGEILDKGGQKLDAAALRAAISGATMRGRTAAGFEFTTQMKPDGSLQGSAMRGSQSDTTTGSWSVNDAGQLCTEQRFASGGGGKNCTYWTRLGEEYFAAPGEARDQATAKRTLSR